MNRPFFAQTEALLEPLEPLELLSFRADSLQCALSVGTHDGLPGCQRVRRRAAAERNVKTIKGGIVAPLCREEKKEAALKGFRDCATLSDAGLETDTDC